MKHVFCWQLLLIFLYFSLNVPLPYSSYFFPYFLPYENCLFLLSLKTQQLCMPTQPCFQCFFPNAERLIGEESWSITHGKTLKSRQCVNASKSVHQIQPLVCRKKLILICELGCGHYEFHNSVSLNRLLLDSCLLY